MENAKFEELTKSFDNLNLKITEEGILMIKIDLNKVGPLTKSEKTNRIASTMGFFKFFNDKYMISLNCNKKV